MVAVPVSVEFGPQLVEFGVLVVTGVIVYGVLVVVLEQYQNWGIEPRFRRVCEAVFEG